MRLLRLVLVLSLEEEDYLQESDRGARFEELLRWLSSRFYTEWENEAELLARLEEELDAIRRDLADEPEDSGGSE